MELKPKESWRQRVTYESLIKEMDEALQFPSVTNAWAIPIKARIDMSPAPGGDQDLRSGSAHHRRHRQAHRDGRQGSRRNPQRLRPWVSGGYFLDFTIKREEIARYGLTVTEVGRIIESAIGGESIDTTVEGRERYAINLRYLRARQARAGAGP